MARDAFGNAGGVLLQTANAIALDIGKNYSGWHFPRDSRYDKDAGS